MAEASRASDVAQTRVILGQLEYVERGGDQSQRRLASDFGVALGLANAYLRRCVKRGVVKASQVPARRYAYYLTPRGTDMRSSGAMVRDIISKFGPERVLVPALLGVRPSDLPRGV